MAIVKMKKLRLMVVSSERETLFSELMLKGCVEVSEPPTVPEDEGVQLRRGDGAALGKLRGEYNSLMGGLTVLDRYAPEKKALLSALPMVSVGELLDESELPRAMELAEKLGDLDERLRRLASEEGRLRTEIDSLEPWRACDVPLNFGGSQTSVIFFGTMPVVEDFKAAQAALNEKSDMAELFVVSEDKQARYLLLVSHREQSDESMTVLRPWGFSVLSMEEFGGAAADCIKYRETKLAEMANEKATLEAEIVAQSGNRATLRLSADNLLTKLGGAEADNRLLFTEKVSFLEGWLPAENLVEVEAVLSKFDCAWETEDPKEEDIPVVPVKLKNGLFTRSMNMVTEMYSLPAYNGVDANPAMAPFFIFFYGMMMADMAYGILMVLAGLLITKKMRPRPSLRNFGELFIMCGITTILWGAATGSFFGDLPYQLAIMLNPETTFTGIPALISPLEDALMILIGSCALGLVQIMTGMAISFTKQVKRGETVAALCNEGVWFLVFVGLGVAGVTGMWTEILLGILVLIVLTQGYGAKGIGGKLTAIGGSLYNNVTGYFGDILSYSRLMALMLAGAVIAQVFNTLGGITGNVILFFVISMVGNTLNFALNLLGCYVHDLRLQCLEFFGKFYEDGGKPFRPLATNTVFVDIKND